MNIEALRNEWSASNEQVDKLLFLNAGLVRSIQTSAAKSQLRWVLAGVCMELIFAVIAVLWLGSFNFAHRAQPQFLVPGLLLHLSAIAYAGSRVFQWVKISEIDYSGPVLEAQKNLQELRVARIKSEKWVFAGAFLIGFPFLLVVLKGLFGVNLWAIGGSVQEANPAFLGWIVANIAFGGFAFVAIPIFARFFATRFAGSPWLNRLLDEIAGKRISQAQADLRRICDFGEETGEIV